jgi:DNA-binding transcriptional ArsR family regulator
MTEKNINGVQKKILKALSKPKHKQILGLKHEVSKSNKELAEELDEAASNISYGTTKLKEKGLIKDTEVFEEDKTEFKIPENVDIEVDYQFNQLVDATAKLHLASIFILLAYTNYSPKLLQNRSIEFTVFTAGFIAIIPSITYNLYKIIGSRDTYKVHAKTGENT